MYSDTDIIILALHHFIRYENLVLQVFSTKDPQYQSAKENINRAKAIVDKMSAKNLMEENY